MEKQSGGKRCRRFSKAVVVVIILLNVVFTAGVLAVFWHTMSEPPVLVASWFAFTTGDLSLCAMLKSSKEKKGGKDNGKIDGGQGEN